jgi:serine/threonine-protein kinase
VQAVGLRVAGVGYAFSGEVFEGQVMSQSPSANSIVDKAEEVFLTVSLGPEPEEIVVPDVVDLPYEQARYLVLKAGLEVGEVTRDSYAKRRRGSVVLQEPKGGTPAERGDAVDLVVNRR